MKNPISTGESPCLTCTRVKQPHNCENKNCMVWRRWFLARWELLRHPTAGPAKVPIGRQIGSRPEQAGGPLHTDPCQGCKYPRALCTGSCRTRRIWEEKKGELRI